jgi:cytochrome P450
VVDGVVSRAIEQRRSAPRDGAERHDLLTLLLEARDEETGEGMNEAQLRDEVATLFAAGHETTANALSWAWALLSQHPSVARTLRAELARVLGGRSPTADDWAALPYTRAVVQETLRLFPPAWMMGRLALEDDSLGGFHIPARSMVFVSPWATHRVPSLWPNPEGFDPERFMTDAGASAETRAPYAYFPFGGGPRVCIGNHFALLESVLVLATLAQRFRVDLQPGYRIDPEPMVTLRPRGGLPATLHALTVPS